MVAQHTVQAVRLQPMPQHKAAPGIRQNILAERNRHIVGIMQAQNSDDPHAHVYFQSIGNLFIRIKHFHVQHLGRRNCTGAECGLAEGFQCTDLLQVGRGRGDKGSLCLLANQIAALHELSDCLSDHISANGILFHEFMLRWNHIPGLQRPTLDLSKNQLFQLDIERDIQILVKHLLPHYTPSLSVYLQRL